MHGQLLPASQAALRQKGQGSRAVEMLFAASHHWRWIDGLADEGLDSASACDSFFGQARACRS